jgi:tRNA(fMet)-specific endonuclease VapC
MYILDTDHLSLLQRKGEAGQRILTRLQTNRVPFAATIISYEEQTRGWMGHMAKAKSLAEQVAAYDRLRQHAVNYHNIPLVGFNEMAALENQNLRRLYPRLGAMDLKIAAVAIVNQATVLTRNTKDFGQIAGLAIEDWTI